MCARRERFRGEKKRKKKRFARCLSGSGLRGKRGVGVADEFSEQPLGKEKRKRGGWRSAAYVAVASTKKKGTAMSGRYSPPVCTKKKKKRATSLGPLVGRRRTRKAQNTWRPISVPKKKGKRRHSTAGRRPRGGRGDPANQPAEVAGLKRKKKTRQSSLAAGRKKRGAHVHDARRSWGEKEKGRFVGRLDQGGETSCRLSTRKRGGGGGGALLFRQHYGGRRFLRYGEKTALDPYIRSGYRKNGCGISNLLAKKKKKKGEGGDYSI